MKSDPNDRSEAEHCMNRGRELFRAGEVAAAAESFARVTQLEPQNATAHFNLGVMLERLARPADALQHYSRATELEPGMAKAWVNSGNILRELGDGAGAEARYRRALALDPQDGHALNNLAGLAFERGDTVQAEALYERAMKSGNADARSGLARTHAGVAKELQRTRRFQEAALRYRKALELDPALPVALSGLGSALMELGEPSEAIALHEQALAKDPRDFEALNNLGCVAMDRGDLVSAKQYFTRAVEVDARPGEPRYNLALIALRQHDFASGWEGHELRGAVDAATVALPASSLPPLTLDNLSQAKCVAVRKEQGIGDQILYSTLLPELRDGGVRPIVETDPRLAGAFRRSVPGVEFVPFSEDAAFAACDHEIALGSLPRLFRPTIESFARQPRALLAADEGRVHRIAQALPPGPKIAISWRSLQRGRHRLLCERKSASLEALSPLAEGGTLVDLQYGDLAQERRAFDDRHPGRRFEIPGLDVFNDLEGVLAAIQACDLVITTSNVLAHFAGALGKPTWLVYLGEHAPFHYWVPGPNGRSLWYPSVEIVSDASWNDWAMAFEAVRRRILRRRD